MKLRRNYLRVARLSEGSPDDFPSFCLCGRSRDSCPLGLLSRDDTTVTNNIANDTTATNTIANDSTHH